MAEEKPNLPQKTQSESSESQNEALPNEVVDLIARKVIDSLLAQAEKVEGEGEEDSVRIAMYEHQVYAGPLPPASELARYEEILPGAADRILKMAEDQGQGRRWLEQNALRWDHQERLLGQIFGFVISLSAIGAGLYAAMNGHPLAGSLLGTGGVVGLAAVFVYGSKNKSTSADKDTRNE